MSKGKDLPEPMARNPKYISLTPRSTLTRTSTTCFRQGLKVIRGLYQPLRPRETLSNLSDNAVRAGIQAGNNILNLFRKETALVDKELEALAARAQMLRSAKAARIVYTEGSEAQLRELKYVAMERGLLPWDADLRDKEESDSKSAAGADSGESTEKNSNAGTSPTRESAEGGAGEKCDG